MLLVLILGSAVGTVAFAGVSLAGTMTNSASRAEGNERAKWALHGASELAKSDLFAKRIAAGATKIYTVAGKSISVTVADNSSEMENTVKLTLTAVSNGKPLAGVKVFALAKPIVTSIWSHGIYSNNSFTWPAASSVTGSVFFRNSISVLSTGGQISQDFKTTSMFNPMGLIKVGGAILTGMKPFAWPTVTSTTYTSQASSVLQGNQTFNGYTFPKDNAIVVVNGNLTLSNAQITRTGTIFVTGSVTVSGVVRANPNDHIVIICPNNITFANGGNAVNAEGYFFAGGSILIQSRLNANGALIANSFVGTSPVNVTWDQWIMADPANGQALKVPGL